MLLVKMATALRGRTTGSGDAANDFENNDAETPKQININWANGSIPAIIVIGYLLLVVLVVCFVKWKHKKWESVSRIAVAEAQATEALAMVYRGDSKKDKRRDSSIVDRVLHDS